MRNKQAPCDQYALNDLALFSLGLKELPNQQAMQINGGMLNVWSIIAYGAAILWPSFLVLTVYKGYKTYKASKMDNLASGLDNIKIAFGEASLPGDWELKNYKPSEFIMFYNTLNRESRLELRNQLDTAISNHKKRASRFFLTWILAACTQIVAQKKTKQA